MDPMQNLKSELLTLLRMEETPSSEFRKASKAFCSLLAGEAFNHFSMENFSIRTPVEKTTGLKRKKAAVLIPILRSGIAMLDPFLEFFEEARVGFFGFERDEKTFLPKHYYQNIPVFNQEDKIILLDPMLATGGTLLEALRLLIEKKASEENIIIASVIAAPEGINAVKKLYPNIKLVLGAIDHKLNEKCFIVPGLGDFGDRYFGTLIP